ncbi:hypothetical protein U1Q18_033406 [Sarracenia purpurea var. burkii]
MKSEAVKDFDAPVVASFSSRGPDVITKDILKGKLSVNYSIASGTSMSCPHAAGAAAYVKTFHPQWSPSAIKSALMTTARCISGTKNPDREFSFGAGHIDPVRAVNPGLVYDATTRDYIKMLCNIGYGTKRVRAMSRGKNISCPILRKRGTARDLNYPSMAAYLYNEKPFKIRFLRRVTNVGLAKSTYKSEVSAEPGVDVKVVPQVLSFNSLGERRSFVVIVSGKGFSKDSVVSGSLVWSDGIHIVRSPIIVYKKLGFARGELVYGSGKLGLTKGGCLVLILILVPRAPGLWQPRQTQQMGAFVHGHWFERTVAVGDISPFLPVL